MNEVGGRRVTVCIVEAKRVLAIGRTVLEAVCPYCRMRAVDSNGEASSCEHMTELEHQQSGSYFRFERPTQ